jgi:hypothetical protein
MKWNNEFLDAKRWVGDPPADMLVQRIVQDFGPDKTREIFTILVRNVGIPVAGIPDYVQHFMDEHRVIPNWVDMERVFRGQRVFADHGPVLAILLYYKSLPTCYLSWQGCETLVYTGRLGSTSADTAVYARRIGETTQFLLDVMTPNSMEDARKGIDTILKVRLIHACIRHFVQLSSTWQARKDELQLPINQEELAYTLQTFSLTMIQGLQQLKQHFTQQEAEDYNYTWKVVGHFLGIQPDMVPEDIADATAQQAQMWKRLVGPSEAGRLLTHALIDFARDTAPVLNLFGNTPAILVRHFMGDAHARVLGVEAKNGCWAKVLPVAVQKLFGVSEKVEDKGLGLEKFINQLGIAMLRKLQTKFSAKGQGLKISAGLEREWGMTQ